MQRLITFILIVFYLASYIKPYAPAAYAFISKTIWKIEHQNRIDNIKGTASLLTVLADMSKNNNPNQNTDQQPDSYKQSGASFICLIPSPPLLSGFIAGAEKYFEFYKTPVSLVFTKLNTPPPKA